MFKSYVVVFTGKRGSLVSVDVLEDNPWWKISVYSRLREGK